MQLRTLKIFYHIVLKKFINLFLHYPAVPFGRNTEVFLRVKICLRHDFEMKFYFEMASDICWITKV